VKNVNKLYKEAIFMAQVLIPEGAGNLACLFVVWIKRSFVRPLVTVSFLTSEGKDSTAGRHFGF